VNMSVEKQLRDIDAFIGTGAAVLTIYLNAGVGATSDALQEKVERLVGPLRQRLTDEEATDLRLEVAVIRDYLGSLVCAPAALALFTCTRRRFFRVVRLPLDVVPGAYWTQRPETGPLHEAAARISGGRLQENGMVALP
jgi:hypothetical protein